MQPPIPPGALQIDTDGSNNHVTEGNFDDQEVDGIDDDDGMDDGSEMVIDTQPLVDADQAVGGPSNLQPTVPGPPFPGAFPQGNGYPPATIEPGSFLDDLTAFEQYIPPAPLSPESDVGADDAMDVSPVAPLDSAGGGIGASTAPVGGHHIYHHPLSSHMASGAGPSNAAAGPSTASMQARPSQGHTHETITPYNGVDGSAGGSSSGSPSSPEGA